MPFDVDLILDTGQTITINTNTAAIQVEGGWMAWVRLLMGIVSGGGTTLDVRVQVSEDLGANYYAFGKFQQLGPTHSGKELAIPVYIPRPAVAGNLTYVRANYTVAGGAPSYAVTKCWLEPMLSPTVRAVDEQLAIGAAALISAL